MLHGIPPSATAGVQDTGPLHTQKRNSLLGNWFHLPCLIALFSMLPQICNARPCLQGLSLHSEFSRGCSILCGSPDTLKPIRILSAYDVVDQIISQLSAFEVPTRVWQQAGQLWAIGTLTWLKVSLFSKRGEVRSGNFSLLSLFEQEIVQRSLFEILVSQRWPSESSKGLDYLLRPGLGKEGHLHEALLLPSPFVPKAWPDDDIAMESIRAWRPGPSGSCATPAPLVKIHPFRCGAPASCVGPTALGVSKLCGWVKECCIHYAGRHVYSRLSNWLESSEVFRACNQSKPKAQSKEAWLQSDEMQKGSCSQLMSREEVDDLFGHGKWRPLSDSSFVRLMERLMERTE